MYINDFNEYIIEEEDLVTLMLQGVTPTKIVTTESKKLDQYNHFCKLFEITGIDYVVPVQSFDKFKPNDENNWHMPEQYKSMDVYHFLSSKCKTDEQLHRLEIEWQAFKLHNLIPLLKYMVYLVDTMRDGGIVWGVGRGSSVSSYILYLIGVHKVDSIKYDLDFKEFLR